MAPLTRRQSQKLGIAPEASANARPAKRDSISNVAGSSAGGGAGRIAKPERKARVVASRYMSSTRGRKTDSQANTPKAVGTERRARPAASSASATRPAPARPARGTSRPVSRAQAAVGPKRGTPSSALRPGSRSTNRSQHDTAAVASTPRGIGYGVDKANLSATTSADRRASRRTTAAPAAASADDDSTGAYASYLQWLMIEARSQMAYDEAKEAAGEELSRLADEAEEARRDLFEEQRKLKLMRELAALSKWMHTNRPLLADMAGLVGRVREPYTRFGQGLAQTTRAMPISGVYYSDSESLVRDLEGVVEAVSHSFPPDSPAVQSAFRGAEKINRLYKARRQEQELLSECMQLKESLAHSTALAVSRGAAREQTGLAV
ncbi:hypothetical protein GGF46_000239 [Coemansia sp. RSA 552]|nr:hypothetical protein GGF46_000239 [Coemansia sp. RSA 552]